jgi:hypothetical protein
MKKIHTKQKVDSNINTFQWISKYSMFILKKNVTATISSFTPICLSCSCIASICTCGSKRRKYSICYRVERNNKLLGYLVGYQNESDAVITGIQVPMKYYKPLVAATILDNGLKLIPRKKSKLNLSLLL